MVTIAAAPDFTEDGFFASFDAPTRKTLDREGVVHVPSDYGAPYPITKRLIEDGRNNLVMRQPLELPFALRTHFLIKTVKRLPLLKNALI